MKTEEIKNRVKDRYSRFAESGGNSEFCRPSQKKVGSTFAIELGLYGPDDLSKVPSLANSLSRGCGNPTGFGNLAHGEAVVDFGCGGGIDVILASYKVGENGEVVGVDFSHEMIDRARLALSAANLPWKNVEFRVADLEATGLPGNFADAIISNCVINLIPDKKAVYREAFRILKGGGRLAVSDILYTETIATDLRERFRSAISGALGEAVPEEEYLKIVKGVGFTDVRFVARHELNEVELESLASCPGKEFCPPPPPSDLDRVLGKVVSVKFTGIKPR